LASVAVVITMMVGPWNRGAGMVFIFGVIYFVLLITLGIISIRKGHWVMFIIGIFFPLFWLIGALLPSRERLSGY
jgi:hypothetical protein